MNRAVPSSSESRVAAESSGWLLVNSPDFQVEEWVYKDGVTCIVLFPDGTARTKRMEADVAIVASFAIAMNVKPYER